ncbi:hypothetical protein G5I_10842 [Acromyrmex echinatior]|uniref:Uncharacterized protein n=1 Tax=Acromyrmex echinatior TaxID=103372 RepID=F4WXY7_ACREC|nr:hypothetical protein G5I_10842 [Acromyrmex echinatior]
MAQTFAGTQKHVRDCEISRKNSDETNVLLSLVETASPRKEERSSDAYRRRFVVKVETDTQGSILDHLDVHSNVWRGSQRESRIPPLEIPFIDDPEYRHRASSKKPEAPIKRESGRSPAHFSIWRINARWLDDNSKVYRPRISSFQATSIFATKLLGYSTLAGFMGLT